jgi:hypothetical protein
MQKQRQKQTTAKASDSGVLHSHLSAMRPREDGAPFDLWLGKETGNDWVLVVACDDDDAC